VTAEAPQPTHPIAGLTDADLAGMLKRAAQITAGAGVAIALILWPVGGWRNAALFAVGAAISVATIYEWQRLIRLFNAKLDQQKTPAGASLVIVFFLLRMILFAAVIYGSLKCFRGSPIALVCGLGLALAGLVWEAMKILRG
jgi:hypothetical protein